MEASKARLSDHPLKQSFHRTRARTQRQTSLNHLLLAGCASLVLVFAGCSRQEPAPTKPTPKPNVAVPGIPTGTPQPAEAAPPPPPKGGPGSPPAVIVQPPAAEAVVSAPTGLSDVEHLNWALGMYHVAHIESPPLKDFEPLVKAKLLGAIPKAPPGKKFVLDGPKWEVRLEDAK